MTKQENDGGVSSQPANENLYKSYAQLIDAWVKHDVNRINELVVDQALFPLKLFILNREDEAKNLLRNIDFSLMQDHEKVFLQEAMLFPALLNKPTAGDYALARETIAIYENAYISNLLLAYGEILRNKNLGAINYYQKALSLAPKSEKIITELVFLNLSSGNRKEALDLSKKLTNKNNRLNAKIGAVFLSSKIRRVSIFILLFIISFYYPYALLIFTPFLLFFLLDFIFGKRNKNRLALYVSSLLISVLLGVTLFSIVYHGLSKIDFNLFDVLIN